MNATVKLAYNYLRGFPVEAYDSACELFACGHDAPVLQKMVFLGNGSHLDEPDFVELLSVIGRPELNGLALTRREMEANLNRNYLDGKLAGWNLIQQCCDMYWEIQEPDKDSSRFWCSVADDADQHDGECCIDFRFDTQDFDTVLRNAIVDYQRPVAERFDLTKR